MIRALCTSFLLATLLSNQLFAEVEYERIANYQLHSSNVNDTLNSNQAMYEFQLSYPYLNASTSYLLQFSIDGMAAAQTISQNNPLRITTTPGKHVFQFYLNESFYEIYTDSIAIKPKFLDVYNLYFERAESYPVMTEKPVIYVYPEKKMDVSLSLEINGEQPFYYPTYKNGWKFSAEPNGKLHFGDLTYNYLFWDAKQSPALTHLPETGFYVTAENVVSFLEEKLTHLGLTSQEQADFITYWGPRLTRNKLNLVHFKLNDACDQFAKMFVSPSPEKIFRVYIVWSAVEDPGKIKQQELPTFDRNGFHVLEWGGQEVKL